VGSTLIFNIRSVGMELDWRSHSSQRVLRWTDHDGLKQLDTGVQLQVPGRLMAARPTKFAMLSIRGQRHNRYPRGITRPTSPRRSRKCHGGISASVSHSVTFMLSTVIRFPFHHHHHLPNDSVYKSYCTLFAPQCHVSSLILAAQPDYHVLVLPPAPEQKFGISKTGAHLPPHFVLNICKRNDYFLP
jgi:hypothetical protein